MELDQNIKYKHLARKEGIIINIMYEWEKNVEIER